MIECVYKNDYLYNVLISIIDLDYFVFGMVIY